MFAAIRKNVCFCLTLFGSKGLLHFTRLSTSHSAFLAYPPKPSGWSGRSKFACSTKTSLQPKSLEGWLELGTYLWKKSSCLWSVCSLIGLGNQRNRSFWRQTEDTQKQCRCDMSIKATLLDKSGDSIWTRRF